MFNINIKELFNVYAPPFLSGIMLVLCFPTFDLFYLAWIVLVPFFFSLYDKEVKKAFIIGVVFGLPYFFGTLYWIYHSINHYGNVPFVISIMVVILLSLYLSLYTGLFASLFSLTIKKTKLPALLIAPIFWVVLEFLRSYIFTGFPWSSIGYSQYKFLTIIQLSDITGIYGVSFLVIALNGALADLYLLRRRVKEMPLFPISYTVIGMIILLVIIILSLIYGQFRLREKRDGNEVRAAIVQGNIEQDKKWEPYYQKSVIETYKRLTINACSFQPSIIVWPETSVPFFFGTDINYTRELVDFQRELNSYLLFGSILIKEKINNKYLLSNSTVLLDKDGKIAYIYDKIHLVPFGEYVPLQKFLFFINKLVVGIGDYVAGNNYIKANTPFGDFATLICYEIIFPGLVRKFYSTGGDFIVNITNDAWFGRTNGPYQHFSMAVFRAIENRKPVIRAANTGVSCFIDSNGRILLTSKLFQESVLTMVLKTDRTKTFYSKYGDLFSYVCIVFSSILMVNLFTKNRCL